MGRGIIIALCALLFLSVGLNVFVLGHMSGRMIAGHHPPHRIADAPRHGGFGDPFRIMRYTEELAPDQRDAFRERFRAQLPEMRHGKAPLAGEFEQPQAIRPPGFAACEGVRPAVGHVFALQIDEANKASSRRSVREGLAGLSCTGSCRLGRARPA